MDTDLTEEEAKYSTISHALAPIPVIGSAPIVAPRPTTATPLSINSPIPAASPHIIPLPNYKDAQSRLQYAQQFVKQNGPLMQGRGDTPLRVNEIPDTGDTLTMKQMAVNAGKSVGIDPALLYSSAMEEGASGLFKDKKGLISTGEHTTDDFPVSGFANFGLDNFSDKFPDLVKKGYLPSDFQKNFAKQVETNEQGAKVNSANFKTANDAMIAKAALLKTTYDDIDSYAKQRKITLSPKARDFFALADYNGGEGTGHQMLNDYYNNGYLEGDKFMESRPTTGKGLKTTSYKGIYDHILPRIKMRDALKEQTLFDN